MLNSHNSYVPNCESISFNKFGKIFKTQKLSFLTVNLRSLASKFDEIIPLLSQLKEKFTCILITETWLNTQNDALFEIPGYISYNFYRENQNGGGLKLYVLDYLNSSEISVTSIACEVVMINITLPGLVIGKLKICGLYRPPSKPINEFLNFINQLFESNNSKMVLLGDFNVNVLDTNSQMVHRYENLFLSYGFQNEINLSTYVSPSTMSDGSCLDHIWHNMSMDRVSYVLKPNLADHYAVAVLFEAEIARKPISMKFRDFSLRNIERYLSNIETEFYHFTFNDDADVNKFSESLNTFLHTILKKYFPFRTKSISCRSVTLGSSSDYQRNLKIY